jgi:hypothetical protein
MQIAHDTDAIAAGPVYWNDCLHARLVLVREVEHPGINCAGRPLFSPRTEPQLLAFRITVKASWFEQTSAQSIASPTSALRTKKRSVVSSAYS